MEVISIKEKIKEAGWHTLIYGIGSIAQSASNLVLMPILTGNLTGEDFGAYALILMGSNIASGIFYLGVTSAMPRSFYDYEDTIDRRAVFTTGFLILVLGAALQCMIGYYFQLEICKFLTGQEKNSSAVFYAFLGAAIGFINYYNQSYFRLLKKSIESIVYSLISLFVMVGVTVYFVNGSDDKLDAAFKGMFFAQIIIAINFIIFFGKSAFATTIKKKEIKKLIQLGVPIIVASLGGLLLDAIDRMVLQHFVGLTEVGVFSAAIRVGMIVNVILVMPFFQIWSPMMMENRSKNNIKKLFTNIFTLFIFASAMFLSLMSIFGFEILRIFVKSEINYRHVILYFAGSISFIILSTTNFFSAGLFYERKMIFINYAYYGAVLIKLIISVVLIAVMGVLGAAFSLLVSSLLLPYLVKQVSWKYFEFEIEWKRVIKLIAIASPSVPIGYYSAIHDSIAVQNRLACFLMIIYMMYVFCLSRDEKFAISSFIKYQNRT